jgi:hypothetical protein
MFRGDRFPAVETSPFAKTRFLGGVVEFLFATDTEHEFDSRDGKLRPELTNDVLAWEERDFGVGAVAVVRPTVVIEMFDDNQ